MFVLFAIFFKFFFVSRPGSEWIKATNAWTDVLNYCLATNTTYYVLNESYDFIYKLLEGKGYCDDAFFNVVVKRIVQPLVVSLIFNF